MELHKPSFSKGPEGFNAIDMAFTANEFIYSMVYAIVLIIPQINQAVVASPSVRMDDTFRVYSTSNDALQRGFSTIRHDLGVHFSTTLQDTEYRRFSIRSTAPFSLDAFTAKIGFINLDFTQKGGFSFTKFGNSFSNKEQIPIDGITIYINQMSYFLSV